MRRILYVAYPLLPVSDESAGGAEQMLATLEREIAARGLYTAVAACEGSRVCGELVATGQTPDLPDQYEKRDVEHSCRTVEYVLRSDEAGRSYDVIHDMSGSFWRNAAALDLPVLATLHLPRSFYRAELFSNYPENLFFNCVSAGQALSFTDLPRMLGVVENGISLECFSFVPDKGDYLLWLGRICEEKGAHVAIKVAAQTGMRLILAGQVYPFSYHQRYYEHYVRPHLGSTGSQVTFVDTPLFEKKIALMGGARAVLVPSLCDETSSLVALETMACGTPVIAFRRGGIPEIVAHGETGLLVDTAEEMSLAVGRVGAIEPRACLARVEAHFSAKRMADDYERLYDRVIAQCRKTRDKAA